MVEGGGRAVAGGVVEEPATTEPRILRLLLLSESLLGMRVPEPHRSSRDRAAFSKSGAYGTSNLFGVTWYIGGAEIR